MDVNSDYLRKISFKLAKSYILIFSVINKFFMYRINQFFKLQIVMYCLNEVYSKGMQSSLSYS